MVEFTQYAPARAQTHDAPASAAASAAGSVLDMSRDASVERSSSVC